jgi:hypothetical protein
MIVATGRRVAVPDQRRRTTGRVSYALRRQRAQPTPAAVVAKRRSEFFRAP